MDTHRWPVGELTAGSMCVHKRACPVLGYACRMPNKKYITYAIVCMCVCVCVRARVHCICEHSSGCVFVKVCLSLSVLRMQPAVR